jgi:hypothetical protein
LERERIYDLWPETHPYGSLDALTKDVIGKSVDELSMHIVEKRASERNQVAAKRTTGEVLPKHEHPDRQIAHHTQTERARKSGISHRSQVKLRPPLAIRRCVEGRLRMLSAGPRTRRGLNRTPLHLLDVER